MVHVDSAKKVTALEQRFEVRVIVVVGDEVEGGSVEGLELRANGLVE